MLCVVIYKRVLVSPQTGSELLKIASCREFQHPVAPVPGEQDVNQSPHIWWLIWFKLNCWAIVNRLESELKYFHCTHFLLDLIENAIDPLKLGTENLYFRKDLQEQVVDVWSITRWMMIFRCRLPAWPAKAVQDPGLQNLAGLKDSSRSTAPRAQSLICTENLWLPSETAFWSYCLMTGRRWWPKDRQGLNLGLKLGLKLELCSLTTESKWFYLLRKYRSNCVDFEFFLS